MIHIKSINDQPRIGKLILSAEKVQPDIKLLYLQACRLQCGRLEVFCRFGSIIGYQYQLKRRHILYP